MASPVTATSDGAIATLTVDAGKLNILTQQTLDALHAEIDRLEAEGIVDALILRGRADALSAGLDLETLAAGGEPAERLLNTMGRMLMRLLESPVRVVAATSGHAVAAGAMLLLVADARIGTEGTYRIGFPEISRGMPLPALPVELARARLLPSHFERAALLGEMFGPEEARTAGFLDRLVPGTELIPAAEAVATALAQIDRAAYAATLSNVRGSLIAKLKPMVERQ